jgi:hypothetical protein
MKIKNNWIFLFLSVLSCFILACPHKNPMPVADLEYFFPPKFVHQSVKIPEPLRQSSDSMAQVVVQYINLFNESEQYLTYLNPPDSILLESSIEPMWNYKWTALEGYYVFLKVEIYPDYSHGWEVKFWGTDTTTGKYYNNWVFLGALQPANKAEGMLSLNYYDDDTILSWYSWKITGDTLKSIYLKTTKDESQVFLDLEIHVCSDLSGELTKRIKISETGFYSREREGIIEYKFSWNANGKGQWWKYDAEGKVIDSGLW